LNISIHYQGYSTNNGIFTLSAPQFINDLILKIRVFSMMIFIFDVLYQPSHDKHLPNQCVQKAKRERA
jgi:hypothetical protein